MEVKPLFHAVEMEAHLPLILLFLHVEHKPELPLHTNPMDDVALTALAKYHPKQEELAELVHAEYQKDQLEK